MCDNTTAVGINRAKMYQLVLFPLNNGATNVYFVLVLSYIAQFGSSVLALGMFASLMVTVMRVCDAITDPIIGAMMDRTSTKIGKFRPFMMIGSAIMAADVFISLTHFKCHEEAGAGGALKNIGMGSGSRAGKMEMHSAGKPFVDETRCIGCGACRKMCAHDAPQLVDKKMHIDHDKCLGCGRCIAVCPMDAVRSPSDETFDVLSCKIAEYAKAVCQDRPCFHISLAMDISPFCDCYSGNDVAIVPDVGMFASFDPVALDQACCEMVNKQQPVRGSMIDGKPGVPLEAAHPGVNWRVQMEHARKIGLGTDEYELITI